MNVIGQRRPLTLRLVRRLHRGVRRHQRIPQLAHSLLPSDVISHNLIHHRLSVFVMAVYRPTTWAQLGLAHTSVLGVTLDSTLSLNKHTSSICQSMYFHVGALRHVRSTLTERQQLSRLHLFSHSWTAQTVFCSKLPLPISKSFREPKNAGTACSPIFPVHSSCISGRYLNFLSGR